MFQGRLSPNIRTLEEGRKESHGNPSAEQNRRRIHVRLIRLRGLDIPRVYSV